jgi:hypothetical protein
MVRLAIVPVKAFEYFASLSVFTLLSGLTLSAQSGKRFSRLYRKAGFHVLDMAIPNFLGTVSDTSLCIDGKIQFQDGRLSAILELIIRPRAPGRPTINQFSEL